MERPLVSWLIPTTLERHRWWKRLIEFLEEDFPENEVECIIVGTQDKDFAEKARKIGESIYQSLKFIPGVEERWERVKFMGRYSPTFNISVSRNLLLDAASGDIVIYRDADTALVRPGFTRFAVNELVRGRFGMLGFPSLSNGRHFKPRPNILMRPHPLEAGLRLSCTANGMATAAVKSILMEVGGWNTSLRAWGEHTAMCTKLARAGYLIGYTDNQYWLSTGAGMSSVSLTNDKINPQSLYERKKGVNLLAAFYDLNENDIFWRIAFDNYKVTIDKESGIRELNSPYENFSVFQSMDKIIDRYPFKPWQCLSHELTDQYIDNGTLLPQAHYQKIVDRVQKSSDNILSLFGGTISEKV